MKAGKSLTLLLQLELDCVKVGFAGESEPRKVLPYAYDKVQVEPLILYGDRQESFQFKGEFNLEDLCSNSDSDQEKVDAVNHAEALTMRRTVTEFFAEVWCAHLLVAPETVGRVAVCGFLAERKPLLKILLEIFTDTGLRCQFHILNNETCALLASASSCGVLVNFGDMTTTLVPYYNHAVLSEYTVSVRVGHSDVEDAFSTMLNYKLARDVSQAVQPRHLRRLVADLCVCCPPQLLPNGPTTRVELPGGLECSLSLSDRNLPYKLLFEQFDLDVQEQYFDESTISGAMMSCIAQLPLDLRKSVANGIFIYGERSELVNLLTYCLPIQLNKALGQQSENRGVTRRNVLLKKLVALEGEFKALLSPFAPENVIWTGASLSMELCNLAPINSAEVLSL